jgi:hypothetical protein
MLGVEQELPGFDAAVSYNTGNRPYTPDVVDGNAKFRAALLGRIQ